MTTGAHESGLAGVSAGETGARCPVRTVGFSSARSPRRSTAGPFAGRVPRKKATCDVSPVRRPQRRPAFAPVCAGAQNAHPGTPGGAGTQNTVSALLRLIGEPGLGDGGVEAVAEPVGMGSRTSSAPFPGSPGSHTQRVGAHVALAVRHET